MDTVQTAYLAISPTFDLTKFIEQFRIRSTCLYLVNEHLTLMRLKNQPTTESDQS